MLKQLVCISVVCVSGLAPAASASSAPQAPQAGTVRNADGTLRPLLGVASNLISGPPLALTGVVSAAFSNEAGLVQTATGVRLLNGHSREIGAFDSAEKGMVLSVTGNAESALIWSPASRKLLRWNGSAFADLALDESRLPGQVVDVEARGAQVDFLVSDGAGNLQHLQWTAGAPGWTLVKAYAGVHGPALLAGDVLLYGTADGLEVEADNSQKTFSLANEPLSLERASGDAVHVSAPSAHRDWILHLAGGRASISEIPAAPPSADLAKVSQ